MIDFDNRTDFDFDFDISSLEKIANEFTKKDIELILTNNSEIQKINKDYRNINKPTDVLSFPLEDIPNAPLGTIVISIDKVLEAATEYNHSPLEELTLLFIHGLLHLLGFNHEIDSGEMRKKEKEIIKKYNLPDSLIIRNEK